MDGFIRGLLDDQSDPQVAQYNPQAGWDTAKDWAKTLYGLTTPGGVQDAVGLLGGPSIRENVGSGNYGDAALQALGVLPGVGVAKGLLGGAHLAAVLAPAAKVSKAAKAAENVVEAVPEGIIAYHGSPHSFDKFDISKIGTGEGAQVYGHGLYFADNEDVAKSYRDTLAGKQSGVKIDGVPVEQIGISPSAAQIAHMHLSGTADMDELLRRNIDALNKHKAAITANPNNRMAQMNADNAQRTIDAISEIKGKNIAFEPNKGSMYQVKINADPESFLDWDKPLMEQPETVRRLAGWTPEAEEKYKSAQSSDTDKLLAALEGDVTYIPGRLPRPKGALPAGASGSDIYEAITNKNGAIDWPITADAEARKQYRQQGAINTSNILREAGIPGIKYLDAGSRVSGSPNTYTVQAIYKGKPYADPVKFQDKASADGYIAKLKEDGFDHSFSENRNKKTNNYVVFDDKLIDILKKYGLAGLLGGAAAGAAGQQQTQPGT